MRYASCGTAATGNIPCDLPMVAEGRFPLPNANPELSAGPRVGDGLIRLGRLLGIAGLALATSAGIAVGFYELLLRLEG